jgi:hypothetical protein
MTYKHAHNLNIISQSYKRKSVIGNISKKNGRTKLEALYGLGDEEGLGVSLDE